MDYTAGSVEQEVYEAANCLFEWKVGSRRPEVPSARAIIQKTHAALRGRVPAAELLDLAARGDGSFFRDLADLLCETTGAANCFVCSALVAEDEVTVLTRRPAPEAGRTAAELSDDRLRVKRIARNARKRKAACGGEGLWAVPVLNCFNPNLVRHVLVLQPGPDWLGDQQYQALAQSVSQAIDIFVAQQCQNIAERAGHLAVKHPKRTEMLDAIAHLIRQDLKCEGVTIFMARPTRDALILGGTTGLRWNLPDNAMNRECYPLDEGRTGKVAAGRAYRIYRYEKSKDRPFGPDRVPPRSSEVNPDGTPLERDHFDSVLAMCFFDDKDQVAGVVRCRNPIAEDGHNVRFFSEDDLALVEAAMVAVQPELETHAQDQRTRAGYEVLVHELTSPLFCIRGAAGRTRLALKSHQDSTGVPILKYNYLDQVDDWLDMAGYQIDAFNHFARGLSLDIEPKPQPVYFFADIVAPAVDMFKLVLEDKGFSRRGIDYGTEVNWREVRRLYVDRDLFNQVVFNLLNNAIKYAKPDPEDFSVRIWGATTGNIVEIHFEDQGQGVDPAWRETIFTRGGRIVGRDRAQIPGYGLGLWLSRTIVELHGGKLQLTQALPKPTRFTITLPLTRVAALPGRSVF